MNIKERIESQKQIKVLALYPVQCRLWSIHLPLDKRNSPDEPHNFERETIQVAYLYEGLHGPCVGFWPGVTGYESLYVDSALHHLEAFKNTYVPTKGVFGMTSWEYVNWSLNAGSHIYKKLTTTFGDMYETINLLMQMK